MEKSSQKPNSYISLQKKLKHYLVMEQKKIRCHREQLYTVINYMYVTVYVIFFVIYVIYYCHLCHYCH